MLVQELSKRGIEIPTLVAPVASYIPAKRHDSVLYVSGQLPIKEGEMLLEGPIGPTDNLEIAQQAMSQCFLNALSAASTVVEIDQISGILRLAAYVASTSNFTAQHLVANGASNLAVELLGQNGKHTRLAIGVPALPLNSAVELDVLFELSI